MDEAVPTQSPLSDLLDQLEGLSRQGRLIEADDLRPFDTLLVGFESDFDLAAEVYFVNDVIEPFGDESDLECVVAQVLVRLPFVAEPRDTPEAVRFCNALSQLLTAGVLCCNERNGVIYFRALLPMPDRTLPAGVLDSVLNTAEAVLEKSMDLLRSVSVGAETFDNAIAILAERGVRIPRMESLHVPPANAAGGDN